MSSLDVPLPRPVEPTDEPAPLMVWTTRADGHCDFLNEAWYGFTGQTPESGLGYGWLDALHPDDTDRVRATFVTANEQHEGVNLEYRLRRHDGIYRLCFDRASPRRDPQGHFVGYVGAVIDITDRRRDAERRQDAEERLRVSEERVRLAVELAEVGIWDYNLVTGALSFSERCKAAFGLPPDAPIDYDVFLERLHPEDRDVTDAHVQAATDPAGAGSYEVDYRVVWPDGSVHWLLAKGHALFSGEGPQRRAVRFMGTVADITRRKCAEQEAQDEARRKDEFLAMLAHELRNPLAGIHTAVELAKLMMAEGELPEKPLGVVRRQADALRTIVDDLLDVSRITRGVVELRPEPVSLAHTVHHAAAAASRLVDQRAQQLRIDVPEDITLWADPVRAEQIVVNLLTNAAKYTPPGGSIHVVGGAEAGQGVLTVEDSGIGMSPDELMRVFELFEQLSADLDREHGGLGIGLTVVKHLAEMHGGSVSVESPGRGHGSTFTVRLPLAEPARPRVQAPSSAETRGPPPPESEGSPRRVLVVDDNRDAADMLAALVGLRAHEVRTAHDAREALEILDVWWADLVILDIGLPGMDGYQLARQLRADRGDRPRQSLVALTGYGQPSDSQRAREAGFDRHVVKPVTLPVLDEILCAPSPS